MAGLLSRIRRVVNRFVTAFRTDCHTSWKLAWFRLLDNMCGCFRLRGLSDYFFKKKEAWILQHLEKTMGPILQRYRHCFNETVATENAPIWICWWSGEATAPPLVQQCMKSTRACAGNHPVYVITEDNYADYIEIPDYMLKLVSEKKMGLAHLADYIRVCLLGKYGGLWVDATIFCAKELPEDYFSAPFFTCKSEYKPSRYISGYRWTTFFLGGHANHVFFRYMKDAFERYWSCHEYAVDYLLFDYLIYLGYTSVPAVRADLDGVLVNNPHRDDLQAAMNAAVPAERFASIIHPDTVLYKLSWRETYSPTTADGGQSVYGHLLDMQINPKLQ